MRKPVLVSVTAAFEFALGTAVTFQLTRPGTDTPPEGGPGVDLAMALQRAWFPPIQDYRTDGAPLADEHFDALMAALDWAMTADETLADFERETDIHMWNFVRRTASPVLSDDQTRTALDYLRKLRQKHPRHDELLSKYEQLAEGYAASYPSPSLSGPAFVVAGTPLGEANGSRDGEPFTDAEVDGLLATLDAMLTIPETVNDFSVEAPLYFSIFGHRIQRGRLSDDQTRRIVASINAAGERHPDAADLIAKQRRKIEYLTPGRVAPNIAGRDTEGVEFELEDYRGNIVVLIFSGQWCGPCRAQYPYHRAMLELYAGRPVALLGVNSDAELQTIRDAKVDEGLAYRTWWDGHADEPTEGPIATAWSIFGWPNTYVLDEDGVIRYVSKMSGELIVAVDHLLNEKMMRDFEEQRALAAETGAGG